MTVQTPGGGPLSPAAEALLRDEPPLWEFRLFAQVLTDEIGAQLNAPTPVTVQHEPDFRRAASWIGDRLRMLDRISAGVTDLLNADHTDAWGPPGQAGDAQAVVGFARRVAAFYGQALHWSAELRQADLHPLLLPVAQEASRFVEPLLRPLDGLGPDLARQCGAILALPPGSSASIEVSVVFEGFDRSRYTAALKTADKAHRRAGR
jgi:hypothetical protein